MQTVKDLKELLESYPESTPVILSSDAEGNKYSPFASYDDGWYDAVNTWMGEFYDTTNIEDEPEEYPEVDGLPKVVVLYPTS